MNTNEYRQLTRIRNLLSRFPFYTVSAKNNTDVARYNSDINQPILLIFGSNVAERVS